MLFDFDAGDYVLHSKYGLGRFLGVENMQLQDNLHQLLKIEYQNSTFIYIPVYNCDIIKFHSLKDSDTKIEQIGSSKILRNKNKLKEDVYKVAHELIKISAARKLLNIPSFAKPANYEDFCKKFEFELTHCQKNAEKEIIADLSQNIPMDRLICADVGFGKTEMALRALFVVAKSGGKALLIAPTTLLANQHYKLCVERFESFGIKCVLNSRLDNSNGLKDWLEGKADVLITTASNKGIEKLLIPNLSLIVLDEEQHFGAKFKEKIRAISHFLQLSATPIPRTLSLSLAGVKNISILETPPTRRKNCFIDIIYENELGLGDKDITQIIAKELENKGRVFIVVPRVNLIQAVEKKLSGYKSEYTIMHGKLSKAEIEKNMKDFETGVRPVLISTTIIESGLNILEANLMLIFFPHFFGISQLYQLRGRVGRADKTGSVYFIASEHLKDIAQERLNLILSHNYFGANFHLAKQDISMRGGGSILGLNQSGHDHGFGLETYYDMLEHALQELKDNNEHTINQDIFLEFDITFEGFNEAYIPDNFIESSALRFSFYKKLSSVKDDAKFYNIIKQLESFSMDANLPEPVNNFLFLIQMKYLAKAYCLKLKKQVIKRIINHKNGIALVLDGEYKLPQSICDENKVIVQFDPSYKKSNHYKAIFQTNDTMVKRAEPAKGVIADGVMVAKGMIAILRDLCASA